MSTSVAVGEVYGVRAVCILGAQVSINTVSYRIVSPLVGSILDTDIANHYAAAYASFLAPMLCNDAFFRGVIVFRRLPTPQPVAAKALAITAGTGGAVALPKQTCGLLSAQTSLSGRAQRARFYVPFPSQSSNQLDGVPTVGYKAELSALLGVAYTNLNLVVGGNSVNLDPVVWHKSTHTSDMIQTSNISTLWATQRRRGDFGRVNASPI